MLNPYALTYYQICCDSAEQVKERVLFLISKGMVFTVDRCRTWDEITRYCDNPVCWRVIQVCHREECLKVINTTSYLNDYYCTIDFDVFVNTVLPTL